MTEDAEPHSIIRDKIMYGSDWHMMSRVPDRKHLTCSFAEVFSSGCSKMPRRIEIFAEWIEKAGGATERG